MTHPAARTILLVEDEALIAMAKRSVLRTLLKECG